MNDGLFGALRGRVLRGLVWKGGSSLARQLMRIGVTVVLARLLSPHDYGVAGMVIVFSTLVEIFGDLALGAALVQRPELSDDDRSTAFWTSVGAGLAFTLLGIALAAPLAGFYGTPAVRPLFMVMSLSFVITAVGSTQAALLMRAMDFRGLELRLTGGAVVGAAAAIVLAWRGAGPWALIAQQVTTASVATLLVWRFSSWRPRLRFSRASLRDLASFSGRVFGTRLLFYTNRNADNVLVGRFVGASALGAYTIAYNIMLLPSNQISAPVQEVLFPTFSRMQDDVPRVARAWLAVNRVVGSISLPALAGMVMVAPEFVAVVLGPKWHPAVRVIQILAWVGMLQSLQGLNSSVLQARNRTRDLLRYGVVVCAASLTAFIVGLHWGLVGVAVAYAVSSTLVEPYYSWLTARALGISAFAFPRALARVVQAVLGMVAMLALARVLLAGTGLGPAPRLLVLVAVGALAYVPLALWRVHELRTLVLRARRLRAPSTAVEPALS
ncbi:MAG: lipopolysaccharide biosynthesis protein [Thermoleophilia bacterium]|nr:lipopolysaccharide biosynthesis protein [Thermoleophilia bacterium]